MSENSVKSVYRKYATHILAAVILYAIVLVVSILWLKQHPPAPWTYFIAVLPVFPALAIPVAVLQLFRDTDEMQKQILLESLAFGFTGAAVLTLTYGFLQNVGLPQVSWVWVWPVMGGCWIVGTLIARSKYR